MRQVNESRAPAVGGLRCLRTSARGRLRMRPRRAAPPRRSCSSGRPTMPMISFEFARLVRASSQNGVTRSLSRRHTNSPRTRCSDFLRGSWILRLVGVDAPRLEVVQVVQVIRGAVERAEDQDRTAHGRVLQNARHARLHMYSAMPTDGTQIETSSACATAFTSARELYGNCITAADNRINFLASTDLGFVVWLKHIFAPSQTF